MKRIFVFLLVAVVIFVFASCKTNVKSINDDNESAEETTIETNVDESTETSGKDVRYVQAKFNLSDDKNNSNLCFLNMSVIDATYEDIFGISDESFQTEKNLFLISGIDSKYNWFRICQTHLPYYPVNDYSESVRGGIEDIVSLTDPFVSEILLFPKPINFYILHDILLSKIHGEELSLRDSVSHYAIPGYFPVSLNLKFEYGLQTVVVTACFVFADSLEEAKEIEISNPDCSLVFYVTEFIDSREHSGN